MTALGTDLTSFGNTVRSLRASLGISQEQLAYKAGLDRTYISDVERGNRNLGLKNIIAIATALTVEPADLFPQRRADTAELHYRVNDSFTLDCGFTVSAAAVMQAIQRVNSVMAALPTSLFRTVDFKAQSGMVGAVFAAELASEVGAIPNPIEKGHPDIVPLAAKSATELQLRNYPQGLEVKSTVGTVRPGLQRAPGEARIDTLTGVTWQAHHRDVKQLMGMVWDYVGGTNDKPSPPTITGVFFAGSLAESDWGIISGTTGRNTKVTGMRSSGKSKMATGAVAMLDEPRYLDAFKRKLGSSTIIS